MIMGYFFSYNLCVYNIFICSFAAIKILRLMFNFIKIINAYV